MLNEHLIQEAIDIPGVDVKVNLKDDELSVLAGLRITSRYVVNPYLQVIYEDLTAVGATLARQFRTELLHHMFTILEDADAPDLQRIKSIARREGITGVVHL